MRLASEILAGASACAILCGAVLWGTQPGVPPVSVGYLGASALLACLSLALDGGRA
jgi:hypothetical protein